MKKIVILLLFLGVTLAAEAQIVSDKLSFGLQLSPTFSWMRANLNTVNGNGTNVGLKLGLLTEYSLDASERYSFTSGLGFAFNHGGTLQYEDKEVIWVNEANLETTILRAKYSVQYVEVPAGLKMRFCLDHIRTCIYGEPQLILGIRTQARGDLIDKLDEFNDIPINDFVSPLGLSWGLGIGAEYEIGDDTSAIGGIYFQDMFTDMTKDVELGDESNSGFRAITIRLGILF